MIDDNNEYEWTQILKKVNAKTGYMGVVKRRETGKFRANIKARGKSFYLGQFNTAEEAAAKYNEAAITLHGKFAYLNKIGKPFQ